jgi:hypothetical protein
MQREISPWLMSTNTALLQSFALETAADRRPDAVIVDWERSGKAKRQQNAQSSIGFEPSMGTDHPKDLDQVRSLFSGRLIVRTNPVGQTTNEELALARRCEANDVLIPMIQGGHEIDTARNLAGSALGVGVMLETLNAIQNLEEIVERRPDFCFIGLVDLALQRRTTSLFAPLTDSLLDRVANTLNQANIPFGFGGMTLPGFGAPIPVELLFGEMCRAGASFGILRRSFLSDLGSTPPGDALHAINNSVARLSKRTVGEVAQDRASLVAAIELNATQTFASHTQSEQFISHPGLQSAPTQPAPAQQSTAP